MMRKLIYLFVLAVMVSGCATTPNLNTVSLGMTKADVIKTLGNPTSVSAKDNVEYLQYNTLRPFAPPSEWAPKFFVRLVNGKVESYGKVGDFDSTKNPTNDVNLNINSDGK